MNLIKTTLFKIVQNTRGQVALFIALVFQILFIFFAMVINVGLLVHHKINLQNSVDLAAYYGAMKQAESMAAIGHINYQIRQGWKLLTFRYRMIGSAGDFTEHPYDKTTRQAKGGTDDSINPAHQDFYDAPAFCATYVPFKPMPSGENTCRDLTSMSGVKLFEPPAIIAAGLQHFSGVIRSASEAMLKLAVDRCRIFGTYNYLLLSSFVVAYNKDQGDRSMMISTLANGLSFKEDDFFDLDGDLVGAGIKKTLKNNLTTANLDSLEKTDTVKIYNSLGSEACNGSGVPSNNPPKWLSTVKVFPAFNYVDTNCTKQRIDPIGKTLPANASDTANFPNFWNDDATVAKQVMDLAQFVGLRQPLSDPYNFSVGVEKNPWCMAYVGVTASTTPKIPFSPFGSVKLVARSFAKPFGGRIGPWYKSGWSSGSNQSNTGSKIDEQMAPRLTDLSKLGNAKDPTRAVNYSRFVGDKFGMKTRNVLFQFGKAIYELDPRWASGMKVDAIEAQQTADFSDGAPNFHHWDQLPFNYMKQNGDLLAWDWDGNKPSRMRDLEIAAIMPDPFDLAYYSIEPDFYHNYYLRIKNKYLRGPGSNYETNDRKFLPDYGYHQGSKADNMDEYSVKDQYKILKNHGLNLDIENSLTYISKSWDHLLTGWADQSLSDYSLNTAKLGHCDFPKVDSEVPLKVPTSGNCVAGGSTGYSVKTVSHDYLQAKDLVLGGESAGSGPLANPPPDDF